LSFYTLSDGAKKVYNNHLNQPGCVWKQKGGQWPSFYRQIAENCVLANFEAGTSVRLEQDLGAESGKQFHDWLIKEEATIVEKSGNTSIPNERPKH
jgi:hypothetical protein